MIFNTIDVRINEGWQNLYMVSCQFSLTQKIKSLKPPNKSLSKNNLEFIS